MSSSGAGPFDTPTAIASLGEFQDTFGQPLTGEYYLGDAVAILSDLTDGMKIVRVGRRLQTNTNALFYNTTLESVGTISTYQKALVGRPHLVCYVRHLGLRKYRRGMDIR